MSPVNRRGFALALVLFAVVVTELLVACAFLVGLHEQRLGRNTITHLRARAAAEAGIGLQVATWDTGAFAQLGVGDSARFNGSIAASASYTGTVTRLGAGLFLVRAEGAVPGFDVSSETAVLVTLDSAGAVPLAERAFFRPYGQ